MSTLLPPRPTNTTIIDSEGKPLAVGMIVSVIDPRHHFSRYQGLVMDLASDFYPIDGPVALFFNRECEDYRFSIYPAGGVEKWDGIVPTLENYMSCPRIRAFRPETLRVDHEFSMETLTKRAYGNRNVHTVYDRFFPFKPGTHACQLKHCTSTELATETTIMNDWGNVYAVYTCRSCHKIWDGTLVEGLDLKDPLPGMPEEAIPLKCA